MRGTFLILSLVGLLAWGAGVLTAAVASSGEPSILQEPARLLALIFQKYHDRQVEEGLRLTAAALLDLQPLLEKSGETELADPGLRTRKVKQVASSLLTLRGMLAWRRSMQLLDDEDGERGSRPASESGTVEPGRSAVGDLERRLAVETAAASFSAAAVHAFREAIAVDPGNPSPHYELGKIYAQGLPGGGTVQAEEEFYRAAVCSLGEGDQAAASATLERIRELNPRSPCLNEWPPPSGGVNIKK